MKNLGNMMKQAQKMQEKMAEMQAQLEAVEMDGASGGGMVRMTMNGKGEVRKVKLDPSIIDSGDVEVLEDLIAAAANDAKAKVETHMQEQMAQLTGGLPLPPGFKMPF